MAAKRLSGQQSDRIAKREQTIIDEFNNGNADNNLRQSLVVGSFGHDVIVENTSDDEILCKTHRDRTRPVCGDEVLWLSENENHGIIEAVLPRRSLLERPDSRGKMRTVAANLDRIVIVISQKPAFNEGLLDRYLVAASIIDVEPVIVLNKVDLLDKQQHEEIHHRLDVYNKLGYTLLEISAKQNTGVDELAKQLAGHTCILVGQSGVGKSSLVNKLLPDVDARTNDISDSTGKGKHTTTSTRLYHLPCGGHMIDSPGIREFGLVHATSKEVENAYPEIRKAADECRFNDCKHQNEPGCAVLAALESGEINRLRFDHFQRILETIAD